MSRCRRIALLVLATSLVCTAGAEASRKISLAKLGVPASAAAGDQLALTGKVTNAGNRRARARITAELPVGDPPAPTQIGKVRRRVGPEKTKPFTIEATVPATATPGTYILRTCTPRHGKRGAPECAAKYIEIVGPSEPPPEPPVFTPGSRSLGDPLLPQLGNGGYDALDYEIDLDYDGGANQFEAATTTIAARATQNLSEFSLDFQDLPVDGVTVNGAPAGFSQVDAVPVLNGATQPMKLVVTPPAGILDGTEFEVAISYHGAPEPFTDPDGSAEGWVASPVCAPPATCQSHFVVGEPIGSQAWFPSNNYPSDKATYTTAITVPAGQTAVGVGEQAPGSPATAAGKTTWTWVEDDPTASYLVTATNGGFAVTESTAPEALTGRSLPIFDAVTSLASPTSSQAIEALSAANAEMIAALGAHYGPYPLDSYGSLWDNVPTLGYALEVQTKSHFSSLPAGPTPSAGLTSTYLHELAHQWWGDAVTLEHWNDIWFNEGWAQLSEWIFGNESGADPQTPEQHFDEEYANAPAGDWSVAPAVLDNDPALLFAGFPTYTRGGMTIQGFREIVGSAAFDNFARGLQSRYAFGNISTEEFIADAKAASGFAGAQLQLLDDYFRQWLYGETKPTITPDSFTAP